MTSAPGRLRITLALIVLALPGILGGTLWRWPSLLGDTEWIYFHVYVAMAGFLGVLLVLLVWALYLALATTAVGLLVTRQLGAGEQVAWSAGLGLHLFSWAPIVGTALTFHVSLPIQRGMPADMNETTVLVIVAVVVLVLLLVGLLAWSSQKRKGKKREEAAQRAQELRAEADRDAAVIPESRLQAQEADLEAERARIEAEKASLQAEEAQAQARQAQTDAAHQEASYEEKVREADRIDPGPGGGTDRTDSGHDTGTSTGTDGTGVQSSRDGGGAHRA